MVQWEGDKEIGLAPGQKAGEVGGRRVERPEGYDPSVVYEVDTPEQERLKRKQIESQTATWSSPEEYGRAVRYVRSSRGEVSPRETIFIPGPPETVRTPGSGKVPPEFIARQVAEARMQKPIYFPHEQVYKLQATKDLEAQEERSKKTFTVYEGRVAQEYYVGKGSDFGKNLFGQYQGKPEPEKAYRRSWFGSYIEVPKRKETIVSKEQLQAIATADIYAPVFTPLSVFKSTAVLKGARIGKVSVPKLPKGLIFRETGISPKYKRSYFYLPKTEQAEILRREVVTGISGKGGLFRETGISPAYEPSFRYLPKEQQETIMRSEVLRPATKGLFRETGISPTKPSFRYLPKEQQAEIVRAELVKSARINKPMLFRETKVSPSYNKQYLHLSDAQRKQILKKRVLKSTYYRPKRGLKAFLKDERGQLLYEPQLKQGIQVRPTYDYLKEFSKTQPRIKARTGISDWVSAGVSLGMRTDTITRPRLRTRVALGLRTFEGVDVSQDIREAVRTAVGSSVRTDYRVIERQLQKQLQKQRTRTKDEFKPRQTLKGKFFPRIEKPIIPDVPGFGFKGPGKYNKRRRKSKDWLVRNWTIGLRDL